MDTRRKLLKKIGLGAAVAGLGVGGKRALQGAAAGGTALPQGSTDLASGGRDPAAGDGPWWLLHPLARGTHLGQGWHLAHLSAIVQGAAVMTLQHRDGDVARVHICNHDGAPRGLAHTELLDLVLMDGGIGDKPTDESLGRVLMGLARLMRSNELADDGRLRQLASMQPHAERVDAYGPESLT